MTGSHLFCREEKMAGSLDDEIRKARQQAHILAQETRSIRENTKGTR